MIEFNKDFFKYIEVNQDTDPSKLRLRDHNLISSFDVDFAISQIDCRKKYNAKFNSLIENPRFLFPDAISAQQASHSAIAKYHASMIKGTQSLLDMTAGLGIDSLSFSYEASSVTAIELNPLKAEILGWNIKNLGINNLEVINSDSIKFLGDTDLLFDVIFIDPSRRDKKNNRLFNLHDCSPDIISNQNLLLKKGKRIVIKASPLLDITQTINDFPNVKSIRAVGVKGECKEILIELIPYHNPKTSGVTLSAVNLNLEGDILSEFNCDFTSENFTCPVLSSEADLRAGMFVLEPSAMIMKISPWKIICENFNAKKLDKSSNIFISEDRPINFPGRVSILDRILKKSDKKFIMGKEATVISRNYPLTSEEIRKQFKLKEGTDNFIYASRIGNKPIIFLTHSLNQEPSQKY